MMKLLVISKVMSWLMGPSLGFLPVAAIHQITSSADDLGTSSSLEWTASRNRQLTRGQRQKQLQQRRPIPPESITTSNYGASSKDATSTLLCVRDRGSQYNISSTISVVVKNIADYGFQPDCPCPRDPTTRCRQKAHICHSTQQPHICTFTVQNVIVSKWGAIVEAHSKRLIAFDHPTIAGKHTPMYDPNVADFLNGFTIAMKSFKPSTIESAKQVDTIVPLRTRWDDCFNHLSFQSMPLIGLVYEFHRDIFYDVHWHASRFTAALLMLLDVLPERIVVESDVQARQLLLPWTPYFNPTLTATVKGVSSATSLRMTKKLLSMTFTAEQKAEVVRVVPLDYRYRPIPEETIQSWPETDRFVVYLNRAKSGTRAVPNEAQLLESLEQNLLPHVHLIVLGPTMEYKKVEQLFIVWQSYARIVNRAIVLVGPHGGGFNNMMWAPADCDLVEFNEFPDDEYFTDSHGGTPVRRVFLNAFFARQQRANITNVEKRSVSTSDRHGHGSGEFWNMAPVKKHPRDVYVGRMQMSLRDLLLIFSHIKNGTMLKDNSAWKQYPVEPVTTFFKSEDAYRQQHRNGQGH